MAEPETIDLTKELSRRVGAQLSEFAQPRAVAQPAASAHPRPVSQPSAVGSPLSRGASQGSEFTGSNRGPDPFAPGKPGRSLPIVKPPSAEQTEPGSAEFGSGMQRAINVVRTAIPFVQRLLPLLDGNIATAVANLFTQHTQKPAPPLDLTPIHNSVTELQLQHRQLSEQVIEQNTSLNKVEAQLEMVREATDRNTLEQQEFMEDLKAIGSKVNLVAFIALGLLVISVLLNLVLFLHIQRVLP